MFKVLDWLALHSLNAPLALDIITAYQFGFLSSSPSCSLAPTYVQDENSLANVPISRMEAFNDLVIPALMNTFNNAYAIKAILEAIEFKRLTESPLNIPHTIDLGKTKSPLVVMNWQCLPEDLICLAHEASHALQITMSNGSAMPPVARETCAFLGELSLIAYVAKNHPHRLASLLQSWEVENRIYLGTDIDDLICSLENPESFYDYRHNYPIVRLAAVQLFHSGGDLSLDKLFASGSNAMSLLPLVDMADKASAIENYLPPVPVYNASQPLTMDAYRRLGIITLLDIEGDQCKTADQIGDYYSDLSVILREKNLFISTDSDNKPIGYATWIVSPSTGEVVVDQRVAPFGNHRTLQETLALHLQHSLQHSSAVDGTENSSDGKDDTGITSIDDYVGVGYALELLAQSKYHRQFSLGDYLWVEILPALWCGQARFYLTSDGAPVAMVAWAWLSEPVEHDIHATGRALAEEEWQSGSRLFFNDWITPYGNTSEVLRDMTVHIFPDEVATSLRRHSDGSVRKVNRWTGANLRKAISEVLS
jgi:cytolysin-activating lysine-acyltransferase